MESTKYTAIIYLNLGHYHLARLEALAKMTPHLLAIEIGARQAIYPWKPVKEDLPYVLESLFDRPLEEVSLNEQKKAIIWCLERYNPATVIVSVYSHPGMRIATQWTRENGGKDILLFSGTEVDHQRIWWREWAKGRLLSKFDALAVTGERSAMYAQKLGVLKEKIHVVGNVADNGRCRKLMETFRGKETEVRKKLKLPRDFFLFVGRISKEKNLPMLLKTYFNYRKSGGTWDLVLVGSGPEMDELKQISSPLKDYIHFVGWKQFDELVAYYALGKCLILPSLSETWGLVVNEAMSCGLPVLVSKNCGCAPDLCRDNITGHVFDPKDGTELVSLMVRYSNGKYDLERMGAEGQHIIEKYTPETWAKNLIEIING